MQKLFLILGAALLLTSTYILLNHKTHSTICPKIAEQFRLWKLQFGKSYDSADLEAYKLSVFQDNYKMIMTHNNQVPAPTFTMAVNGFADLTKEEFRATYLGSKPTRQEAEEAEAESMLQESMLRQSNPSSVNWTTSGSAGVVQNQGQCGSCWAFSACGSMGATNDLFGQGGYQYYSEQQLVDCSALYGNEGCNGGYVDAAFKYVIANGIATAEQYPYTGVTGTCKQKGGSFKITGFTNIPKGNCNALQTAIVKQPTSVCVDASDWQFYSTGTFGLCGKSIDHCVLAAGYTPNFWYIKNSWGSTWGMNGYIQLKLGDTCAVCDQAAYPLL